VIPFLFAGGDWVFSVSSGNWNKKINPRNPVFPVPKYRKKHI
jgi:hypothetical protein